MAKRTTVVERGDEDLERVSRNWAARFRALSGLFDRLASPEGARQLLDGLVAGDAAAFARLVDAVDVAELPQLGKCFWLREIIELSVVTPTVVEVCVLRDDLTAAERMQYLRIAARHGELVALAGAEVALRRLGGGPGISPGPFLDELKAVGLVTCTTEVHYDVSITQGPFGMPQRVCV